MQQAGLVDCPDCDGKGFFTKELSGDIKLQEVCEKCRGLGKIIEKE